MPTPDSLKFSFAKSPKLKADTLVLAVYKDSRLPAATKKADSGFAGIISHALEGQKKFSGKPGQTFFVTPPASSGLRRILLVGLGDAATLDSHGAETAGGKSWAALAAAGADKISVRLDGDGKLEKLAAAELAGHMAAGIQLRSYGFDKFKSKKDKEPGPGAVEFTLEAASAAERVYDGIAPVVSGIVLARDFINEPPNTLYPGSFANMIAKELKPLGVEVEIFDEKRMEKLGFHAALAVGMGSSRKPRIVVMRWNGPKNSKEQAGKGAAKKMSKPLAFVGKGVTFDTGGYNIKPSGGMEEMKLDMAGAAAVVGLMKSVAKRKSPVPVVGIVGLAENMVSSTAYRPSDVIDSHSGQTIEVMNTDAEGRLVLADCLSYIQDEYKPRLIVDLATLTGAMMIALGQEYCGTFVNDDKLWAGMEAAAKESGEKLWRMPLDEAFRKELDSAIADIKSLGNLGRYGGACVAAGFLERFIKDKTPWAHMDIAGTAWVKSDRPTAPKPAVGFGVRTLDRLVASYE
jgi:leucyl aminopeptidase